MSEQFKALIQEFGAHVGIEDTDEIETTSIVTVDDVEVELVYREDEEDGIEEVILMASLGTPAEGRELITYRTLLEGNLLGSGTGGGSLGLNPETGEAVASVTALMSELNGEVLAEALDGFVDIVNFWRGMITTIAEADAATLAPEGQDATAGHITP